MNTVPLTPVEKILAFIWRVWARVVAGYQRLERTPVGWVIGWAGAIARWYKRRVWDRWARGPSGKVEHRRAVVTLAGTIIAFWVIPFLVTNTANAVLMATTWHANEKIYLTSTQELDAEDDVHSVRGCVNFPCTEKEAIYFRVKRNFAHDVYSVSKRGYFFYPEEVAGVVAPGVNDCQVTSYGIRIRALRRGWGVYPNMLNAVCVPYKDPAQG